MRPHFTLYSGIPAWHPSSQSAHVFGLVCLGLALLFFFLPTQAATLPASELLPAIAVFADPAETSPVDPNLPTPSESVTRRQLQTRNIVNTEDALKYLPNLAVRKRYIGDKNSLISVRGTSNTQSARGLVFMDGLLISNLLGNSYSFPPRWSMIFPDDIERVDVVYGPFSALYPGNALGATVLVTTHMPETFEANADIKGFSQHYALFGIDRRFEGKEVSASIGDKAGAFSYLLGINRLENVGQPMQFATLPQSNTPATKASIPVTGAYFYDNQTNARTAVFGISNEGIAHTTQDQFKLKLQYDLTPSLQGGATLGYWHDQYRSENASFLYDAAGNPVYQGKVNIEGYEYVIPASTLAPSRGETENWLYGLSLRTHHASGWNSQAVLSYYQISHSVNQSANNGAPGNGPGSVTFGDGSGWKTIDVQATYTPESSVTHAQNHWFTFGYHFDTYNTNNVTYNRVQWRARDGGSFANAYAGRTQTQAVYAQDAWHFLPRWKLISGLRWENWQAYGASQTVGSIHLPYPESAQQHLSPKLALSFDATDDLTLRAALGRAYRFPTVGELFQGKINGNALINNNPHLQAENALSKEFSAQWIRNNDQYRVSLFEDDVKNTLFSQTDITRLPTVTNFQNIDRVRSRGIETSYEGKDVGIAGMDFSANAAFTQSRILANAKNPDSVGKYFHRVPLWRINVVGTYHLTPQAAVTGAVRYSGRQYNTLSNEDHNPNVYGGTSSYTVVDAKFTYQFNRHVSLNLGIDNLFDQRAFVFHPYPGRTIYLESKLRL